jgi:acrylyl-CoA reductase (NADPH)
MGSDTFRGFTAATEGDTSTRGVTTLTLDDLPDGVLIDVERSSVNYKDGLAASATGRVARISPIVPGIDLAGTLVEAAGDLPAGTRVLAHGYDIGVSRHGGFAERARVPAEWLVPLPDGLDARSAMAIGTAGYTAGLSVLALQEAGITPDRGPVLVTGATGGVGSTAVSILAGLGYEVVASSGKPEAEAFLTGLGATSVLPREELAAENGRPLQSTSWAGAIDCVGGTTLANVLARLDYGGAVAASGLTGGTSVATTVMPFILRAVRLIGIDSVQTPIERRREVWAQMAGPLRPRGLDSLVRDIGLTQLDEVLDTILAGGLTGRVVVDVRQ